MKILLEQWNETRSNCNARVAEYLSSGLQLTYAGANPAPGTMRLLRLLQHDYRMNKYYKNLNVYVCTSALLKLSDWIVDRSWQWDRILVVNCRGNCFITNHSGFIKENYDEAARRLGEKYEYERWGKNISARRDYAQTLRSLLCHLRNRRFRNVLEIGCGVGTWTIHLRNYCDSITVADISKRMVEITISRLRRLNFRKVSGVVCDFQKPCLRPNEKYDAVFCIRAIEYMEDKFSALLNVYDLLNYDGFVFIITKNPHRGLIPFLSLITKKTISKLPKLFAHEIHYKNLLMLMRKAGFTNVEIYPTIVSYPIASYDASRSILIEKNEALLSNVIFDSIYQKRLNPLYLPFCIIESYCATGRK